MGAGSLSAQDNLTYQKPPKAIADLVEAPNTPSVNFDSKGEWMLLQERPGYGSIEELAQPELRIGGLRLNPATNGPSRAGGASGLKFKKVVGGEEYAVTGLPANARISSVRWSNKEDKVAFLNTTATGISLWVVDVATRQAKKLTDEIINDTYGSAFTWLADDSALLISAVKPGRGPAPKEPLAPKGPIIQATSGDAAPSRTYQDLLKNPYDEQLLEYYMTSQLMTVDLNGSTKALGKAGVIKSYSLSPDGKYLMVSMVEKPYSYLVPVSRFPSKIEIWDATTGNVVKELAKLPLDENRPTGFDATVDVPRSHGWRADADATLYWVEAQDGGDPRKEVAERDVVFTLSAPFTGQKQKLVGTAYRYGGIAWSDDNFAIINERWTASQTERRSIFNPSNPNAAKTVLIERSYNDTYNDPGSPVYTRNEKGRSVLLREKDNLFMISQGGSPEGNMPFIATFNTKTKKQTILWRCEAPYYERPVEVLSKDGKMIITLRESEKDQPNYFMRDLKKKSMTQVTNFAHPYESLKNINKQLVTYKRKDGLNLSAVVYTPAGYDPAKDGRLPVVMWAYPREYRSADVAAQVRGSKYEFTRLNWGSPLYWVTQGYAIMDRTEFPIVGEGETLPNDLFVEQLVANAEAAIDFIVEAGIGDRNRVAVGGHSYGAFMTANLLTHSDLFAAGIARSGAYNRTLTPFGFQAEERTFWEAPEIYGAMSPFFHADKMKHPLLLIHGEADNNSGTFPIQSERYYNALKGHGATTRLVFLPHESHGYAAMESILHTLWEQDQWLDKHVKNKQ
nr:prolyl oligopeptidase family serine peptidase [Penaeicola halotolerans]